MIAIVKCHFNALSGVLPPCVYQSPNNCTDALDVLSSYQYRCVYHLVKTWIICAYAICDA
ncbi:hypothetical protein K492DRAFT_172988 [Lichtheimia hyalospora FSU 10163]|nr:hypothetical protein K492DRAFT_172988 [Lichtheimia hyalospora FSU 10163]